MANIEPNLPNPRFQNKINGTNVQYYRPDTVTNGAPGKHSIDL